MIRSHHFINYLAMYKNRRPSSTPGHQQEPPQDPNDLYSITPSNGDTKFRGRRNSLSAGTILSCQISPATSATGSERTLRRIDSLEDLRERFFLQLSQRTLGYPTFRGQVRLLTQETSIHGIRFAFDHGRPIIERWLWKFLCLAGLVVSIFALYKIFIKWEQDSVITSVANTNYPVSGLHFPAVTVCTVNKAVSEKLIIQGCRFNHSFSEMKKIISAVIDPEEKYNEIGDEVKIEGKVALKYLRLVAPKCENILLQCRWNSIGIKCADLFTLTLTDKGYCCTFNSAEKGIGTDQDQKLNAEEDEEVRKQELEFNYLKKAVSDYAEEYRAKTQAAAEAVQIQSGINIDYYDEEEDAEDAVEDEGEGYTCLPYGDELFPGVCRYINKCREDPKSCNLNVPEIENSEEKDEDGTSNIKDEFPLNAVGAGRGRGLLVMADTLICDSVPTGSFKGLAVGVHHPDQFPLVGDMGFVVGPGQESNVAVTATDVVTYDELRSFYAHDRGCYFTSEFKLRNFQRYSRDSCVIECEYEFMNEECECAPFFAPGNYTPCTRRQFLDCGKKALDNIQQRKSLTKKHSSGIANLFSFRDDSQNTESTTCGHFCLAACSETSYSLSISSAPFPNQPKPNNTKLLRDAIAEGKKNLDNIRFVRSSVNVIRIFFSSNSAMQYKRHEYFTWVQFVANLGSVIRLFLGLSLLGAVEIIYFLTLRLHIDRKNNMRENAIFMGPTNEQLAQRMEEEARIKRDKWWRKALERIRAGMGVFRKWCGKIWSRICDYLCSF